MLNECNFIGNIGKIELRNMQSGGQFANLSIAVSEGYKDKAGEWQDKTTWINCVLFNEYLIKKAEKLNKGDRVYLSGKLQTRTWDKDGVTQYVTEIVCQKFDGKLFNVNPQKQSSNQAQNDQAPKDDLDDKIPF